MEIIIIKNQNTEICFLKSYKGNIYENKGYHLKIKSLHLF